MFGRLLLAAGLLSLPAVAKGFYFCTVEVENPFPLQHGFINYYLTQKVEETLLQTGWVQDCKRGKTVRVRVKKLSFEGASISNNRYSGYNFSITFAVELPGKSFNYSLGRYVPLPDPALGDYAVREVFADLMDSYQIRIKRDLLYYMKGVEKNPSGGGKR